jgi:glycosyltransferase involved in cell wall biosynthesis
MKETDFITIIIPTHNRSDLFEEAIDSLIQQTNPNWRAIVVDDNSTPEEKSKIKNISAKDPRISFSSNKGTRGASATRNIGLQKAASEYVLFMDSDDVLAPNCIENRSKYIVAFPNFDFWVFGGVKVFHENPEDSDVLWNVFTEESDLERFLKVDPPWHTSSPIWNKEALKNIGGFNEKALVWNDWELHIRAIAEGLKYTKINSDTDAYYRKHELEAISKKDKSLENTLNRFETLEEIVYLLKKKDLFTKKVKLLLSQQLFFMQLEYNKNATDYKNLFQLARKRKLLPDFQYRFWKKYLSFYTLKKKVNKKKAMDKFAYTFFRYHFLEVDTKFLKKASNNA